MDSGTEASTWAPLRLRTFRWLWLGVLVSSIGTYMQTVGAQWLVVDAPNAATLVSLVASANSLPIMLLALPAGVLADAFDRRRLLLAVQAYLFAVGLLLAVLTATGTMPPALLLAFTFALGAGVALQLPPWQAVIPDLVPRAQLRAAARVDLVGVNLARSVGPALAGLVIAWAGVPTVFALNAASVVVLAVALLRWRRPASGSTVRPERFVPALRAGGRYVWHDPVVRRVLLRVMVFVIPAMALWALLPLIASQRLGLGAGGYGVLFGALGVGAVGGAVVLGRIRTRVATNALLAAAGVLYAATLAAVVLTTAVATAVAALVLAGAAWMAVTSTLGAEMQLVIPAWVRARGLGVYTVVFCGSQTAGALVSGLLAQQVGLRPALLVAGGAVAAGVAAGAIWPVPATADLGHEPVVYWSDAQLAFDPEPDTGPVLVSVYYTVAPEKEEAFLDAMTHLRRSRRRTGASRWELYRDAQRPDRFIENFRVPSWEEHLRQHDTRLTAADQQIEQTVQALSDPPPRADHLLPP